MHFNRISLFVDVPQNGVNGELPKIKKKKKRRRSLKQWERWMKYREKKYLERAKRNNFVDYFDYSIFNESQRSLEPPMVWVPAEADDTNFNGGVHYPVYYSYPVYYPSDAAIEWQPQDGPATGYNSESLQYSEQLYFEPGTNLNSSTEDGEPILPLLPMERPFGNTCASVSEIELVKGTQKVLTTPDTDIESVSDLSADEKPLVALPTPSSLFAPKFPAINVRDQEEFCNMKDVEESLERLLSSEPDDVVEEPEEVSHGDDDDDDDGILSLYASSGLHVKYD